ncbi:META domain-containing protein [Spirosoma aureum]|uniref:META domain-containing protein n=1 Tax=Spirosoma aureum TaxID=2692134 RepID=A0A6G9AGK0_9BACT|nr:META domain-containing protein [Spirosoma aureum]QIP11436.1 META domain-containing protein [Spirosoma aureum]
MKNGLIISLLILVITIGCGKRETEVAPLLANLVGTWKLIEPDSSYAITLQFAYDTRNPPIDITPYLASGKSSVNEYSARMFATIDGTMQINEVVSTEKAGSPAAMQFEQDYFANLKTVARFESPTETQLRLYHGGPKPGVLVYKKVLTP